jgi:hypothetical protein
MKGMENLFWQVKTRGMEKEATWEATIGLRVRAASSTHATANATGRYVLKSSNGCSWWLK